MHSTKHRTKDAQSFLGDVTDRIQEKRLHAKVEDLSEENVRLRAQVDMLSGDLKHERDEHEQLVDLLKARPSKVKVKRRGGILRVIAIGGAAYVLGAKAGKERYESIRGWFGGMRERVAGASEHAMESATETISSATDTDTKAGGSTTPMPLKGRDSA
ncbi:MAG TPA: hypothetical protein VGR41_09825 [Actinomycetota bacterium]|jgi:hypothetical protein|nr:hypothetical protein [Actinomycetota bacterium]